jgi:carbon storage regulator
MLVLARREGEAIVIAGGIRVSIVSISRSRVRLGIDAPTAITVDREEIHKAKYEGNSGGGRESQLARTAQPAAPPLAAEAV